MSVEGIPGGKTIYDNERREQEKTVEKKEIWKKSECAAKEVNG